MNEYLMIFRNERKENPTAPSAEQMKVVLTQWQTWIKDIVSKGRYGGTNRLLSEGRSIKPGNIISDGPYAEVKEIVGGYLIVKAESIDEATEMAKSCPALLYDGNVEVRLVMSIDNDPASAGFLMQK